MKSKVAKGSSVLKRKVANSNTTQRSLISALSGLLFFGAWAFAVNYSHGTYEAVKSACVQGTYSFTVTLVNSLLMEFLFRKVMPKPYRFWGTIILTSIIVCGFSWLVNTLAATPEIWLTILPGCIISSVFAYGYVFTLHKTGH